ncbi:NAD(P)-dependent oxidoreductase [Glycomyces arizonensis]|uniref:NAD(P)-dependent oxidoreductase n=1 Tax=Glycomyces arizonensis TaxID=256035 RepID=UPI0003FCB52F|nr:NAD(P)-binding oxidoreductase [Glycomyces arizonensis]
MHITVLGATGTTGQQVVERTLRSGHRLTALLRDPARLPQRDDDRVSLVVGDATDAEDLKNAMTGSRAVIATLGAGLDLRSDLASRAARAVLPAAEAAGVARVVWLSSLGAGSTLQHVALLPKLGIKLAMRGLFADKALADELIRSSRLDWTIVYPLTLTNGPRTGKCTAVHTPRRRIGSGVSRADAAEFMLGLAETGQWSRRAAILSR